MAFIGYSLLALVFGTVFSLLLAWPTMLLFGAVHSFLPVIPAFGFWQTVAIILLLNFLFNRSSSSSSND